MNMAMNDYEAYVCVQHQARLTAAEACWGLVTLWLRQDVVCMSSISGSRTASTKTTLIHASMPCLLSLQPRLESCMRAEGRTTTGRITYAGRDPSASTATGYGEVHAQEQARLIEHALDADYKMQYA